jgi:NADH-quinone oxidoreductase subunit N
MLMLPEIVVLATAFVVLFVDLFTQAPRKSLLGYIALAGLAVAGGALALTPQSGAMFGGRFELDAVGWWFKLIFLLAAAVTVALSMDDPDETRALKMRPIQSPGEYFCILLFVIVGMLFLVSARDLATLYVSLELATIPLFAMAAWRRDHQAGEAGLKYMVLGAASSALMLFGMSLLYGLSGSTGLTEIARALSAAPSPALWLAVGLLTTGIGFKLTVAPFHMWAPDVYQGAPTPITAFLSVASKCTGLVLLFHLLFRVLGVYVSHWGLAIALFATATMTLGNLVAIVQQNVKRFMAYSAISQAGYLLMGLLGPTDEGIPAIVFYMLAYAITNLAAFAVIIWYENRTGHQKIEEYHGLAQTNPYVALCMMLALFGLAGIPPLSGFVGKFFLFSIASKAGFNWLVAVAAVNSTISLYYYLRLVRAMYIEPPAQGAVAPGISPLMAVTAGVTVAISVVLGVIPFFYETIHAQTIGWLAPLTR